MPVGSPLGFEWAGFPVLAAVDNDAASSAAYQRNRADEDVVIEADLGDDEELPLSIVAAGWSFQPPDGHLASFYSVVSNSFIEGRWVREPRDTFLWTIRVFPERQAAVFHAGRTLPRDEHRALARNLKRLMSRGINASNAIRLMAEAIRYRARFDKVVGEHLLVNCLPKAAVPESGEVMLISGAPLPDVPTFLYMPATSNETVVYGPTFVCGGAVMSNFEACPL